MDKQNYDESLPPMRLAIFVDQFPVRSQTFVLNQIVGLINLGFDVEVITMHKGDVDLLLEPAWGKYHLAERCSYLLPLQSNLITKLAYRIQKVIKGLLTPRIRSKVCASLSFKYGGQALNLMLGAMVVNASEKPFEFDWIICHFGPNGVIAAKLREIGLLQGKITTIFHGQDISIERLVKKRFDDYQYLFHEADLLLPISELWKKKLITLGATENKLHVNRMGVNLVDFTYHEEQRVDRIAQLQIEPDSLKVVFTVARFTEKKGLCYAIESLSLLPKSLNVQYRLAGFGELEGVLKELALSLGVADNVLFLGPISSSDVIKEMEQADVFLQPSVTANNGDMEGVPVTLMEAMASGTPILSTYHSGIPELVTERHHGLLVPEKNAQAIADGLTELFENTEQTLSMIRAARKQVERLSDNQLLYREFISLLRQSNE